MRWMLLLLFPAMVAIGASAAMAQGQAQRANPAVQQACRGDVQRLCSGVQPGGGRIAKCLREHVQQVSPQCLEAAKASKGAQAPR